MFKYKIALTVCLAMVSIQAFAGTCGSAKVLSGNTCSNVKVEMHFDGCTSKIEPLVAPQIICTQNTIKARYQTSEYRYESIFEKHDDGWGEVKWKGPGTLVESVRPSTAKASSAKPPAAKAAAIPKAPTIPAPAVEAKVTPAEAPAHTPETVEKAQVAAKPEASTPPAPATPPAPPTSAAAAAPAPEAPRGPSAAEPEPAGKLSFSGYADLRFTNYAINNLNVSGNPESGFGVEDGAFYATYEKGKVLLTIDVPFRRAKVSDDLNPNPNGTHQANASNSSLIQFGGDKAQIYGKYKVLDYLAIDVGQWDTPYGVEVNDSKDRVFGKTGLVYDYLLPVTHTGAMVEFSMGPFSAKGFAANPNNKGSFGDSASGDNNTEYGGTVGFSNDWLRGQVGYMSRSIIAANGTDRADRSLIDATAGTTLGPFTIDFEFGVLNDPSKNTLTAGDATDREEAGLGFLALATYKIIDPLLIGFRYEHLDKDPGGTGISQANAYGGSLHYKLNSQLELRTEYVYNMFKQIDGTPWDNRRFNVATLFYF